MKAFEQINNLLRQEDFSTLPQSLTYTDNEFISDQIISVLLIKNDSIIIEQNILYDEIFTKNRSRYSSQFRTSLLQAFFLEQQMPITSFSDSIFIYDQLTEYFVHYYFSSNNKDVCLDRSISFYLFTLLLNAHPVDVDFVSRYSLKIVSLKKRYPNRRSLLSIQK